MSDVWTNAGNDLTALAQTGAAGLAELPWGAHAAAGAGLIAGVALLVAGRRLLRIGIILAAAALGGAFAFYASPTVGIPADPNLMLAIGLALGAIAGILLYRATISVTCMVLLAAVGPLIAAGVMKISPDLTREQPTEISMPEGDLAANTLTVEESIDAAAEEAWKRVRAFIGEVRESAGREWNKLDGREKSVLAGSSMLGAALGLLLGAAFHKRTAAVMSAFLGAGLALPSSVWLTEAYAPAAAAHLPTNATVWLALWAGLSVAGAAVQWTGSRKTTDS